MDKIILLMLSEIDLRFITALCQSLEKTFYRQIEVGNKVGSLKYAYDTARKQYKSPLILSRLRRMKKEQSDKIMGVVDVDLFSPGYDFIYGEADIDAGAATLSINRLVTNTQGIQENLNISTDRIVREATHEIGHLYSLGHCPDQKCVMRICTCLSEVDAASGGLCAACTEKLKTNL